MIISPEIGFAGETFFGISLTESWNLDGNSNLKFKFWGRENELSERFLISNKVYDYPEISNNAFWGLLPELSIIETEIWGETGDPTIVIS